MNTNEQYKQLLDELYENVRQELANYCDGEKEEDLRTLESSFDMSEIAHTADKISAFHNVASYICDAAVSDTPSEKFLAKVPMSVLSELSQSDSVLSTAAEIYSESGYNSRPDMGELLEMTADVISDRNRTILESDAKLKARDSERERD